MPSFKTNTDIKLGGKQLVGETKVVIEQGENQLFQSVTVETIANVQEIGVGTNELSLGLKYGDFGQGIYNKFQNFEIQKKGQRLSSSRLSTFYKGRMADGGSVESIESFLNSAPEKSIYFIPEEFKKQIEKIVKIPNFHLNWDSATIKNGYLYFKTTTLSGVYEIPIDIGYNFAKEGIVKSADTVAEIMEEVGDVAIDNDFNYELQYIEVWGKGESVYSLVKRLFGVFKPMILPNGNGITVKKRAPTGSVTIPANVIINIDTEEGIYGTGDVRVIGKPEFKPEVKFSIPKNFPQPKISNTSSYETSYTTGNTTYKISYIISDDGSSYPVREEVITRDDNGEQKGKRIKTIEYNNAFEVVEEKEEEYGYIVIDGVNIYTKIKDIHTTRQQENGVWLKDTIEKGYALFHHIDGQDLYGIEVNTAKKNHSIDNAGDSIDVYRWTTISRETEELEQISDKFAKKVTTKYNYLNDTVDFKTDIIPTVKTREERVKPTIQIALQKTREVYKIDGDKGKPPIEVDFIHADKTVANTIAAEQQRYQKMQSSVTKIKALYLPNVRVGMGVSIQGQTQMKVQNGLTIEQVKVLDLKGKQLVITAFRHTFGKDGAFTEITARGY